MGKVLIMGGGGVGSVVGEKVGENGDVLSEMMMGRGRK